MPWTKARLRANSLEINPEFDPQSVAQEARESTATQIRLAETLEQSTVENKNLRADNEQLAAERDEYQSKSRRLENARNAQLRGRCLEVSRDLFKFCKEIRGQDTGEAMRQYNEQLRDRVD